MNLLQQRLASQQLADPLFQTPADLVQHLCAIQAQDYNGSRWAVGIRLQHPTLSAVEKAIADGMLIRTHVLRPTWHLVCATDLRWLLALTAPYVQQFAGSYYRKMELDAAVFTKAHRVLRKALQGGQHLTREELGAALAAANIPTNDLRLNFLMIHAELEALICSGARRGKQITYALLEERVPPTPAKTPEEALYTLTERYFASRGPATLKDFAWWSGLPITLARKGIALLDKTLTSFTLADQTYWLPATPTPVKRTTATYLLPNYDEYLIAYKDREVFLPPNTNGQLSRSGQPIFNNTVIIKGQIAGTWKRLTKNPEVEVELFEESESPQLDKAIQKFKNFMLL